MKSPPSGRLASALGRTALFWGGYIAILLVAAIAKGMVPARWGQLVWGAASSAAILVLTVSLLSRERSSDRARELSASAGSALRFLVGMVIGVGNYAAIILATSVFAGPIRLAPAVAPSGGAILLAVCTVLALATMEELGFRGYPLRTLLPVVGARRAQAIVAVAFGISHLAFGWSWQSILFGVLPSAILFGAAAIASGGLAMPIGVHAAMNLARWATGETDSPGLWTFTIAESARGSLTIAAPVIGLVVTLASAAALASWRPRTARRDAP